MSPIATGLAILEGQDNRLANEFARIQLGAAHRDVGKPVGDVDAIFEIQAEASQWSLVSRWLIAVIGI